jgi:hypothetical protein
MTVHAEHTVIKKHMTYSIYEIQYICNNMFYEILYMRYSAE